MEQVPEAPAGFQLQPDFISPQQETRLLDIFRRELQWPIRSVPSPQSSNEVADPGQATTAKQGILEFATGIPTSRISLHYGHHFCYKFFGIDRAIPYVPFPQWLKEVLPSFCPSSAAFDPAAKEDCCQRPGGRSMPARDPDQVCLQYYPPGAGIPPHADTHSAFESLMGLSLGSGVAMEFRRRRAARRTAAGDAGGAGGAGAGAGADADADWEWERCEVFVPPRSLYNMSGDSQYHFQHGIKKRKNDRLPPAAGATTGDGEAQTVVPRGERFSITFRWVRDPAVCECGDEWLCDTAMRRNGVERVLRWKEVTGAKS